MFDPYNSGFWKGKKVLVTGGASFIGSHLCERLVDAGSIVRVADDFSSGKRKNLSSIAKKIRIYKGDLRERPFAEKVMKGIDIVFHLAASHGGRGFIHTHPVECSTNLILDGVVFAAAHKAKVDRICFASSACVYPSHLQDSRVDGTKIFLREEDAHHFEQGKANADLEYGWAKFMGEMVLNAYYKQYGQKSVSCRIFTAYGERENETHAVVAFIARAFIGMDPYIIWGTGEQDRNFTYVGDTVEGLMRACERITDGSPINVGTAEHITVNDAVAEVFSIIGFTPKKIKRDLTKPVGVFSRAADTTRNRALLKWEPKTSFTEGFRRTISWYTATKDKKYVRANLERLLNER
ncbi:MAG: NAD-dependent epimerase/dehydratase family protein [Minisyncoccia bacterium]|jgi:UDP-glucose 4-epimerase